MKKITLTCLLFFAGFSGELLAQINPIDVTGFNEDVVANGVGAMAESTTTAADADSFCLLSLDWKLNAEDPEVAVGLPITGEITSPDMAGLVYQIPSTSTPYEVNNSLRIDQSGVENAGTITFTTPDKYSKLYFLVFSGNGNSEMDITVNFNDATSETFTGNVVPDWFGTGLPVEIQGFGRGDRSNNNVETPTDDPKLFRLQLDIAVPNQTKDIASITFVRNNMGDDAVFNLLAVSGMIASECLSPYNVVTSNNTQTSVDISWDSMAGISLWDIEFGEADFVPTGIPTTEDTTNPTTVTGLTADTHYEFYVRSDCGNGEVSLWAGPFSFRTGYCASIPSSFDGNGISNVVVGSTSYTGTATSYLDFSDTPVDLHQGIESNVQITFDTGYTYGTNIWIDLNDNFIFESSELMFTGISESDQPTTLNASFSMPLTAPLGNHGMRIGTADYGQGTPSPCYEGSYGVTVDFVVNIVPPPSCLPPTNLSVTDVSPTSANLVWTENGIAAIWDVEYGESGFEFTGTPTIQGVGNPVAISGLTANTTYEFYVRADCGADDQSPWVGPFSFTTPCESFGEFSENFDSLNYGEIPNCWGKIVNSTGYASVGVATYDSNSDPNNMELYCSGDADAELFLITPVLTDLPSGTHRMRFYAKAPAAATLEIGTMSNLNDSSTFTLVETIATTENYQEFIVFFNTETTDNYIAFRGTFTGTYYGINIDDITWEAIPSCPMPQDITVVESSETSAELTWSEIGSATTWDIEYGFDGFAPTGTPTETVTSNPYIITDLQPGANYDFYVRSNCDTDDLSLWVGPYEFNTVCNALNTPDYMDDFTFFPNCWEEAEGGEPSEGPSEMGSGPWFADEFLNTGDNISASIYLYSNVLSGWLISPAIDLSEGDYELTYKMAITDYFNSNPPEGNGMGSDDEIKVLISEDDGATWEILKIYNQMAFPSETGDVEVIGLTDYEGVVNIAFWATEGTVDDPEAYDVFIDDFEIRTAIITCAEPINLMVTNIFHNAADLSWDEVGNAEGYEWFVFEEGANPDNSTPIANGSAAAGVTMVTVTNLEPETNYDFYVFANCGTTDGISTMAGPEPFTTTGMGVSNEAFAEFSFYPNPTNGVLSLKAKSSIQQVIIYNLIGKKVYESRPERLTASLQLSNLQAGTYLMKVIIIDNSVGVYRIIKE